MKTHTIAISFFTAMAATLLNSCDALWGVDIDSDYTPVYTYGVGSEWAPSLPGAPLISPVYWGNAVYPGPPMPPLTHIRPVAPNRPSGNIRPGQTTPASPSGTIRPGTSASGEHPIVPSRPINITGGQPGIALPPAGTGFTPTQGRH